MKIRLMGGLSQFSEQFSDRRIATSGYGILEVLYMAGFLGAVLHAYIVAKAKSPRMSDWLTLLAVCAIAGAPHFFSGHRGGTLYPLFIAWLTVAVVRGKSRLIPLLPLLCILVLVVEQISGHMRLAYNVNQSIFDWSHLPKRNDFPLSFRHTELLACTMRIEDRIASDPNTIMPSMFNWIPRFLYPSKPLTTGPKLATYFTHEWFTRDGRHTSALTTGPMVELFYNFRTVGTVIGLFALGCFYNFLAKWYYRAPETLWRTVIFVFQAFFWGWILWVEDLGGFVNKQVCFVLVFLLAYNLHKVFVRRPARAIAQAPPQRPRPAAKHLPDDPDHAPAD